MFILKNHQIKAAEILLEIWLDLYTMIEDQKLDVLQKTLFTGAVDVSGEGVSQNVDFGMGNSHKVTLGTGHKKWTDTNY